MTSIPASELVQVIPSVISAGGNALAITPLVLTKNTRPPIGSVLSFPNQASVSAYFGPSDPMTTIAGVIFAGFTNSDALPAAMLVAQYPAAAVSAYIRGGNISAVPLATLQGYSGTLGVTIDGVLHSAAINLSGATSFSNAASIIGADLAIEGVQAATFSGSAGGSTLNVATLLTGTIGTGDVLSGTGVVANTYITGQLTGAVGGVGTYSLSTPQTFATQNVTAFSPAVQYDSVSGAFVILSGTTGPASTITYGSGAMATSLLLTALTGAVLSQGTGVATPAAFMTALINVNQNWVTFMTAFDPDGGAGSTLRQAFAAWKNTALGGNRFCYVCYDTDPTPTNTLPATSSLGYILAQNGDSGTCLIWEPSDLNLAAFVCGAAASIDFTETNGHISFAYKSQAGLVAGVTDPTSAQNLAGNPQVAGSFGNGYNFYGAYASANQSFSWFQRGTVTGTFTWLDSYIEQIWLNSAFAAALLNLQENAKSIPYNTAGDSLLESALADPIQAGLNFGAFGPGTLSASQIAQVNNAAGTQIAPTLQTQGYYLQILPASAATRNARTSPSATFWYITEGSVQAITLNSVALL